VLALAAINPAAIRAALFDRSLYYVSFPRHLLRVLSRFAIHFVTSASATIARGDRQEILCLLHSASRPSPSPSLARARARARKLRFFRESARRWSFRLVLARARIRCEFKIETRIEEDEGGEEGGENFSESSSSEASPCGWTQGHGQGRISSLGTCHTDTPTSSRCRSRRSHKGKLRGRLREKISISFYR